MTSKARDSESGKKSKESGKKREANFMESSARAYPFWEDGLGVATESGRPRPQRRTRCSKSQIINMNFLLLLFLVFFAPLLLFAGEPLRPYNPHNCGDCALKVTLVADISTSMARGFFMSRKSSSHSRRWVFGATEP